MPSELDHVPRRALRFESVQDILDDIETLAKGPIRTTGHWTAAQIVQHIADSITHAIDGFDVLAPEAVRTRARRRLPELLENGFPTGIRMEGPMADYMPDVGASWEEACERLREAVGRAAREPMTAIHPMLGAMDQAQWQAFQCRHAELHFSFLHPDE